MVPNWQHPLITVKSKSKSSLQENFSSLHVKPADVPSVTTNSELTKINEKDKACGISTPQPEIESTTPPALEDEVNHWTTVLQTGMRGAFGKPQGTVARVHIGQVIMSIRTKLQNKEHVIEALRRAKFKFPGRQKIHISKKWGFTKFNADEFENMVAEMRLIPDGCGVKYIPNCGPLDKWRALHS
ncbi:hypothetical protein MJG53_010383 [Ovis ammon polii x Ovis aries]|uniref:Uncharacterized protein n=1 Tax=Ovis ammon polii x Ovis aries TaxID=2918886 RepID=A0ACB9UTN9_9CETA|nr:hypothetical protein MJG53_010383 [Ovis ammon polii x Ovis aries]